MEKLMFRTNIIIFIL